MKNILVFVLLALLAISACYNVVIYKDMRLFQARALAVEKERFSFWIVSTSSECVRTDFYMHKWTHPLNGEVSLEMNYEDSSPELFATDPNSKYVMVDGSRETCYDNLAEARPVAR